MRRRFVSVQDLRAGDVVRHNCETVAVCDVQRSPDGMHWRVHYATAARPEIVPNGARFERTQQ